MTAKVNLPDTPIGVDVDDGNLWVGGMSNELLRIDTASGTVKATIPVGNFPARVLIADNAVWAANYGDNTVSRIDPKSNKVTVTIKVGVGPFGLAATSGAIWVADSGDNKIVRIDSATNRVVASIQTDQPLSGQYFRSLAADAGAVWVVNPTDMVRIDPATNKIVATLKIAGCCGDGYVAAAGGAVWITSEQDNTAHRIDPATNTVAATVHFEFGVHAVAISSGAVWVVNQEDAVSRVDPATNAVVVTVTVGQNSHQLAVGSGAIWIPSFDENNVYKVEPDH